MRHLGAPHPLIFIRKISREDDEDDGPDEVQSRFYCPLLAGGFKYVSMSRGNSRCEKMPFENFDLCHHPPPT